MTGDEMYREWGWQIFQAIEKHCKIPTGGYAGVNDVDAEDPHHIDNMETFFLVSYFLYILGTDGS